MLTLKRKNDKGFTLIELLVVIGILAVLLSITLVALNPRQNFQQANDTQRQSDVNAILNAINQYAAQNNGQLPAGITSTPKLITSTAGATNVDLCATLVPTYMADLPHDPVSGSDTPDGSVCTDVGATYDTGYTVVATSAVNGSRVTVTASGEITATISVTR